jgi:hypothetical protein
MPSSTGTAGPTRRSIGDWPGTTRGSILSDDDLETLGILFPDHRYGELVFLLDPGWLVGGSDFNGRWTPDGMHGYHPDDPSSDGVFLSKARPVQTVAHVDSVMRTPRLTASDGLCPR